jgi:hypothetical protein
LRRGFGCGRNRRRLRITLAGFAGSSRSSTRRKDGQKSLSLATEAIERFARGGQLESEWRAWLVVSGANALLGNRDQAIEQAKKSLDAMRN